MEYWQQGIVISIGVLSLIGFLWSVQQCWKRDKSYSHSPKMYGYTGAFVWADLVVFGLFWTLVSLGTLLLNDWILFLLTISVFWLVRSIGETQYWFHQQFTPRGGNEPKKFWFYKIFKNDSVWFVHQIYWQCITVVTIITSLYLSKVWLSL